MHRHFPLCVLAWIAWRKTFLCVRAFRIYINYVLNDVHCSFVPSRNVLHCQQYTKSRPRRGPLWDIIIMHVLGSPFQRNCRPHSVSRRDLSFSQHAAAFLALKFFFSCLCLVRLYTFYYTQSIVQRSWLYWWKHTDSWLSWDAKGGVVCLYSSA